MFRFISSHTRGLVLFLVFVLVVLFGGSFFLNANFRNVQEQESWVTHTYEVITELEKISSSLTTAESSQRGYIITKDDQYLAPYRNATIEVWAHLNKLKQLTIDNPTQRLATQDLQELVAKRLKMMATTLSIATLKGDFIKNRAEQKGLDSILEAQTITNQILHSIQTMKDEENKLLQDRSEKSQSSRFKFEWSLLLTTLFTAFVVILGYIQIRRVQLQTQAEEERKANFAWSQGHLAEISKRVAGDVTLAEVSKQVLHYVGKLFPSLGANFYVRDGHQLRLTSTFASGDKMKFEALDIQNAYDGLLGEAFQRNSVWQVDSVPQNYFKISSSLGESDPNTLVFVPISFQGRSIAIAEFALFSPLPKAIMELLGALSEPIGIGVNAAQSRENLQNLLEKTQIQTEELQSQQEELQSQQEELRTNNEELEQQARALENQQQALTVQNQELEISRQDVESKAEELLRASQYKSEFLAKMSHELRTPLNSLLILATLLMENKEKNLTDQQREFAKSMRSAGNDLLSLVNDILDLSKIEARKLSLRPESFSLERLLKQMKDTFSPQVNAKEIAFNLQTSSEIKGLTIHTDQQRLEQVLRNFLSNAIKFTDSGSITLSAQLTRDEQFVRLAVSDTGIGIPKSKKDLIFEAFEQADGSVSRKYGGTGLGLTISRELAGLLGGEIELKSEVGKGSEFSIEIPIHFSESVESKAPITKVRSTEEGRPHSAAREDEHAAVHVARAREAVKSIKPGEHTLLIVEDDANFRHAIVEAVQGYGFQPIEASSGEVALEILNLHTPSAILLDIKLPGVSGLGLLELIKQMPHMRHVPIHMVSAMEYQQNALRMGAMGYLGKPVTMDKIRAALSRVENLISKKMKRLLIVEDDIRQRDAVKQLISGVDIEVTAIGNGEEALKAISSEGFDCIILDLVLPDMSGFELLKNLNSLSISLPPIVIYTGKDLSREEEEQLRKYSESIIIKGARSPERLLDEVNLFLHRVEALLPQDKRDMLTQLRSQEKLLEGKNVLLVDDDIRNVFALTSALESKGLVVRIARNGLEALDALKQYPDTDIVLMDLMMPKMDGLEATRRIRQMEEFKSLPIVALTAKAMKEDHEKCLEAGANDYLPKPINLSNLVSVMKVWLAPKGIFL